MGDADVSPASVRIHRYAELQALLPDTAGCIALHPLFHDDLTTQDPHVVLEGYDTVDACPRRMPLVHLDDEYLVVSKPPGILINNGIEGQLDVDKLVGAYWHETHGREVPYRNCHQIDFATSGLLVLAQDRRAAARMGRLFEERRISKSYLAILHGHLETPEPGKPVKVTFPIGDDSESGGARMRAWTTSDEIAAYEAHETARLEANAEHRREERRARKARYAAGEPPALTAAAQPYIARRAETHVYPLHHATLPGGQAITLALLKPITGRRHQLRVHCKALGHPILGDRAYETFDEAQRESFGRMWLHAWEIEGTLEYKPRDRKEGAEKHFHWMSLVPWDAKDRSD